MPSPFPGMDPYLERADLWSGVHHFLISHIANQLGAKLRPKYVAAVETRIEIGIVEIDHAIVYYPDIAVTKTGSAESAPAPAVTAAPLELDTAYERRMSIASIEIRLAPDQDLVTVIEVLSPINKRPGNAAHDAYLEKRFNLLNTGTHLLEIDLLRKGRRIPTVDPLPPMPYFVFLSRAHRYPRTEVWPIALRDPLPTLPVPLLDPDPDAPLDLGAALSATYDSGGGYDLLIDYNARPPGPFSEADAAWFDAMLREKALRR